MLNYDTILSSFDDKVTLMQWLKKVESALQDASATGFEVVQTSETTAKLKLLFADGSTLESDEMTLPRGPQGPQGEQGEQGEQGPQGPQGPQGEGTKLYKHHITSFEPQFSGRSFNGIIDVISASPTPLNTSTASAWQELLENAVICGPFSITSGINAGVYQVYCFNNVLYIRGLMFDGTNVTTFSANTSAGLSRTPTDNVTEL